MCMPRQACTRSPILSAAGASPRSARRALAGLTPGSLLRAPGGLAYTALRAAGYTGAGYARSANLGRCPSPRQGVGHPLHPPLQEGPSAMRWAPLERSGGPQLAGASSLS